MKTFQVICAAALALAAGSRAQAPASNTSAEGDGIAGVAVGGDRVYLPLVIPAGPKDMDYELVLNDTQDRVGANVSVCGTIKSEPTFKGMIRVLSCQSLVFVFPQLRYDPAAKQVLWGREVVARHRFWRGGLALEKGFKPDFIIVQSQADQTFNHVTDIAVEFKIVRAP